MAIYFPNISLQALTNVIAGGAFVNAFNKAEVRPIYKKDGRTEKSNNRPSSGLSNVSKIYERCIYDQIYSYFDQMFSKNLCGFRKGFNTQHILLAMIINNFVELFWKMSLRHLIVSVTTC